MYFLRDSCIRIPQCFSNQAFYSQILTDLTRVSKDYNQPDVLVTTKYYTERDGHLLIPRHYKVEKLGHNVVTYLHPGQDIEIEFKSSLRDDKQRNAVNFMVASDHGVLCMQPGEGKTVVAIAAISQLKKKSIIFVHKDSLATQWIERFIQHSNITQDQIGILSTDGCREVLDKPVVVSTVQTMCSMIKRLPDIEDLLAKSNFGVAVWDECHTSVSAEQFSLSSLFLPSARCYGLSATPSRADGNTDIIEKHLGMVYVPEGQGRTLEPKITMIYFDHRVVAEHYRYIHFDYAQKGNNSKENFRFDKGKYLQMLTSDKDKTYIPTMQKICSQIYSAGRTTLFLADRIKILDMCAKAIPNKHDIGFFIPRSADKRDSDLKKKFVFSTYGSARDGTDRPEFDCLVLATNCSNIEQAIGRVVREHPNKQQPMVFDIVDTGCKQMEGAANFRKEFYTKKGWQVEEKRLHIK